MSKHDNETAPVATDAENKTAPETKKEPIIHSAPTAPKKVETPAEAVPAPTEKVEKKEPASAPVEPAEPPKVIKPAETVVPAKKEAAPVIKVTSAEIMSAVPNKNNVFAARRAMNAVSGNHSMLGNKLIKLFADYKERMAKPTKDREEIKARIKMLQNIVNTACPTNQLDMQTATDVVRVMFDSIMDGWGTVYNDANIFKMGETLKGTAYEMDKMVIFVEAFIQMVEAVEDKNVITFSEERLDKVIKNPNVVVAIKRIRDNINKRNGFSA